MKIKLIYPSGRKACPDIAWWKQPTSHRYPGLGLTMVAALCPKGTEIAIIDDDREEIDWQKRPDLVGLSLLTSNAPRGYTLAQMYREKGIPVVLGGMHVTACPEEAMQHADALVVGEAEDTWPVLVRDFEAGKLQKIYRSSNRCDLRNLPFPRKDLLIKEHYITVNNVQASRGCPFNCEFCSITALFGFQTRFRPVDEVVEEIRSLEGDIFVLNDDNIAQGGDYFKELFRRLIPLKKRWAGNASWNIAKDAENLDLLKRCGCGGLFVGFESLQPQREVRKTSLAVNMAPLYKEAVEKIRRRGIGVIGAFIFGFDNEDETIFRRTLQFALESRIDAAQINILVPFPGTRLHGRLEAEGRITERNWGRYMACNLCFRLKNMEPQFFMDRFLWVKKKLHTYPRIIQRVARTPRQSGIMGFSLSLGINLGNRRAIRPGPEATLH